MKCHITFLLAVVLALPAFAHHGWSEYDTSAPITLEGKITDSQYRNPHAMVDIDHGGQQWHAVLAPISRLRARGVPPEAIAVGQELSITGYVHKRKRNELRAERIRIGTQVIELR